MNTEPESPHTTVTLRGPSQLSQFENRFTELSLESRGGAAVSAAWAWLAESAKEEREAQQLQQQEEHARDMWLVEHARRRYVEERWRHELEREEVRERQGQRMDTDATGAGTDAPLATEYSNS